MSLFEPGIEQLSSDWLVSKLQDNTSTLETAMVILDCRKGNDFEHLHIKTAVSFAIPAIMLRRFAIGKLDLVSIVRCPKLKSQLSLNYKKSLFVLYHSHDINFETVHTNTELTVFEVLCKRLRQDGCKVVCLKGGFLEFSISYPEYCESNIEPPVQSLNCDSLNDFNLPLLGLKNLKIENNNMNRVNNNNSEIKKPTNKFLLVSSMSGINSSTESSDNDDNSTGFDDDRDFPVEILQNLFLGNASNSSDNESLLKNNITYILNVTSDLPNVFENESSIKYLQIPIMDHWSQNLASYFPKAIDFIEEARIQKKGVLVHCLAGISRSVTIIVAYLMYKCCLSMNDAFNLVRSRKSNISPNFHFMQQLNTFEQELSLLNDSGRRNIVNDLDRRRCLEILDNINQTPDSGIEFDKYSKLQKSL